MAPEEDEQRIDAAYGDALRLLRSRPLTNREVDDGLSRKGHEAAHRADALERLHSNGYLDDVALALHYILARAERLGHGPRRLTEELGRRGVSEADVRTAWDQAIDDHGLDPRELLQAALRRRLGSRHVDDVAGDARQLRSVYNALLRAGFEEAEILGVLGADRSGEPAEDDSPHDPHGRHDDLD